jgi:hypothetical protein
MISTRTKLQFWAVVTVVVLGFATGVVPLPNGKPDDDDSRIATGWLNWSGAIAGLKVYWQFGDYNDWNTSADDDTRPFEVSRRVKRGELVSITGTADNDLQAPYECVIKLGGVDIPGSRRVIAVGRGITCTATVKW